MACWFSSSTDFCSVYVLWIIKAINIPTVNEFSQTNEYFNRIRTKLLGKSLNKH